MPKKKQIKKPKEFSVWFCENCQTKEMTHAEMLDHLRQFHKLDTKKISASKQMTLHLDGRDFYTSQYRVVIDNKPKDIVMTNAVTCKRAADDIMRYV